MKKPLDPDHVAGLLSEEFGLVFEGKAGRNESGFDYLELSLVELHRSNGFRIVITLGWRSLEIRFIHGPYAAELIEVMGNTALATGHIYSDLVSRILGDGATFRMVVNDNDMNPRQPESWPSQWTRLALEMNKSPLAINTEDRHETENAVVHWGGRFLACILTLVPLEEEDSGSGIDVAGLPEGAKTRIEVNRYERNYLNRATCLQIHGDSCKVCETVFEAIYGEIGQGFIHVHHTTPVSKPGEEYQINPATDLIPVCPNCHAMLHRRDPPYSVGELKDIIASQTSFSVPEDQFAKVAESTERYDLEKTGSLQTGLKDQ